jgi:hypothetical protein
MGPIWSIKMKGSVAFLIKGKRTAQKKRVMMISKVKEAQ